MSFSSSGLSILRETIKYLDKSKSYRIGTIFSQQSDETVVTVLSAKDIYDIMVSGYNGGKAMYNGIKGIASSADTLKKSLSLIGFSAANTMLNLIKTSAMSISIVQKTVQIYRTVRSLMERVVDTAHISKAPINVSKIAQDVLQYIARLAVSSANKALLAIWQAILSMPIIAIFQRNGNEAYIGTSDVTEQAEKIADDVIQEKLTPSSNDDKQQLNTSDTIQNEPELQSSIQNANSVNIVFTSTTNKTIIGLGTHRATGIDSEYIPGRIPTFDALGVNI